MKRLILFTLIFFSGLLLAGCDLIPTEVVDQLSEDLCRDNPENELCDIENLNDLEEDVVKGLVENAFTEIKDGNTDACNQVFAITNTDLLDECKSAASTLLPTDVTDFEVIEVVKEGDFYIIKGRTNNSDEFIEIKVSVGEVEGNLRITTWEASTESDPVLAEKMSAEDLIKAFFADHRTLSQEALCEKYYDGMEQTTCSTEVDDLGMSMLYEVISVTLVEAGLYSAIVQVGTNAETEEFFFRLDPDDDGDSILTTLYRDNVDNDCDGVACPADGVLGEEEVKMVFMQFLTDFVDSTITDEELANMYFGGILPEDIKEGRAELTDVTFNFISIMAAEDMFFEIEFEIMEGTNKEVEKVKVRVNRIDMAYQIEIVDNVDDDCDGEVDPSCMAEFLDQMELKMLLEEFIADYQDPMVSNEDILAMYFFGLDMGEFLEERTMDLEAGTMFTFVSLEPKDDGEMMIFELTMDVTYSDTTSQMMVLVSAMWVTEDMAILIFDGEDNDCDGVDEDCDDMFLDLEATKMFFEDYLVSYLDASITDQEFANMYFNGMLDEKFTMMRQKELTDGVSKTLESVTPRDDGFFDIAFRVVLGNDIIIHKRPGRIRMQEDLLIVEWMEMMDEDLETDITVVEDLFKAFIASYLDPTLTDQQVADMFFDGNTEDMLSERQMDLEDGFMVEYLGIEAMEMGVFVVHLELLIDNETMHQDLYIKVKRIDAATPLLIILDGEDNDCDSNPDRCYPDMFVTDITQVEDFFKLFLADYLDPDSDDDTIASVYLLGEVPNRFFDDRAMNLSNGTVIMYKGIMPSEMLPEMGFDIELEITTTDGTVVMETITVAVLMIEDMMKLQFIEEYYECDPMYEQCHNEPPFVREVDKVQMIIEQYLNDFINPDLTFEDISEMYYMGMAPEFLRTHRDANLLPGTTVTVGAVMLVEGLDSFFDISYDMTTPNGTTSHMITVRVSNLGMMYFIEDFDEDNECHTNPEVCYFIPYEMDEMKIEMFFKDFLVDYADETMSNDMINEKYFGWMAPEMLLAKRLEDNTAGAVFVYQRLLPSSNYNVDSFFDITYQVTYPDGSVMEETLTLRFIPTDMGLMMEPYDPFMEVMYEIFMFTDYINDQTIPVEEVCAMFDQASMPLCNNIVAYHRDGGYYVWVEMMESSDEVFVVTLLTEDTDGVVVERNTFAFSKMMDNPLFTVTTISSENPLFTPSEN